MEDGIEPELGFWRMASRLARERWDKGRPAARFCDGESECEREGKRAKREGGGHCGARKRKGASTRTASLPSPFRTLGLGGPSVRSRALAVGLVGRNRDMGFAITS